MDKRLLTLNTRPYLPSLFICPYFLLNELRADRYQWNLVKIRDTKLKQQKLESGLAYHRIIPWGIIMGILW